VSFRTILTCLSLVADAEDASYVSRGCALEAARTLICGDSPVYLIRLCLTDLLSAVPLGCALWWRVMERRRALPPPLSWATGDCPCGARREDHESLVQLARHINVERDIEELVGARLREASTVPALRTARSAGASRAPARPRSMLHREAGDVRLRMDHERPAGWTARRAISRERRTTPGDTRIAGCSPGVAGC
jgi:hypothetical protein